VQGEAPPAEISRCVDADMIRDAVARGDRYLAARIEVSRAPAIPRNALGKVERARLRERAEALEAAGQS
jgi:acyl-coenzyme A synthetase/AMP-(fatty) acid ligase